MRLRDNEVKFGDMELYRLVSRNIKFYRNHHRNKNYINKKLTQMELAEAAELSRSIISSIESDKFYIEFSIAVVNRCARVCNVPIEYYFMKQPPEEFWK